MDQDLKGLQQSVGRVVEDCGRMLRRKPPLAKQDLTDLHDALDAAAKAVLKIRDATFQ